MYDCTYQEHYCVCNRSATTICNNNKKRRCATYHRYTYIQYMYVWNFLKVVRSEKMATIVTTVWYSILLQSYVCYVVFQSEKTIWLITAIITNFPQKVCYFLELHIKAKQKAILAKNFTTISWGPHHPESRRRWRIEAGTQNFFRFNLVNDTVTFSFLLSKYIVSVHCTTCIHLWHFFQENCILKRKKLEPLRCCSNLFQIEKKQGGNTTITTLCL